MKFINKGLLLLAMVLAGNLQGQENDVLEVGETASIETKKDTVSSQTAKPARFKVDGVAAVIGDFVILDSDIFQAREGLKSQNVEESELGSCRLLNNLMETKLYAHHAIVDSLPFSETEIRSYTNQQIEYFKQQLGSEEQLLKFYRKESVADLEKSLMDINKNNSLAQAMQQSIVQDIELTPEEIREYFKNTLQSDLPVFGVELEISKILIEPEVPENEKQKVIDELNSYRTDILENGSSFATKAVLWSQDEGSRGNGGLIPNVDRKANFVKEFRDVAFSLQEGEISEPFETEFGYHIIMVEKIKGTKIDLRHILRVPKITREAEQNAKDKIEKIKQRIEDGELTFAQAAKEFSDEKETASDGGILINPTTQDRMFELKNLPTEIYPRVRDLKESEISQVFNNPTRTGNTRWEIYTVSDRVEEHEADFAQDYVKIKNLALQAKRIQAIKDWKKDKINETYIKINGDYRDCTWDGNWIK
ncbi:MAG: peptidylprolyl isomerase [Leeuwenhoekiella sp.]